MAVDIKQLSRGVIEEAFGNGKLDYIDRAADPSCKVHDPLLGDLDIQGFKQSVEGYRKAFPDLKPTLLAICAEGDLVAMHWRISGTHEGPIEGVPPTHKRITVEGMSLGRYRGGKMVESFVQWDVLGFLQQLGVVPQLQAQPTSRPAPEQPSRR